MKICAECYGQAFFKAFEGVKITPSICKITPSNDCVRALKASVSARIIYIC